MATIIIVYTHAIMFDCTYIESAVLLWFMVKVNSGFITSWQLSSYHHADRWLPSPLSPLVNGAVLVTNTQSHRNSHEDEKRKEKNNDANYSSKYWSISAIRI